MFKYAWFLRMRIFCLRESTACAPMCFVYVAPCRVSSPVPRQRPTEWQPQVTLTFSIRRQPHCLRALLHGRRNRRDTAFMHTHTTRYLHCFRTQRIWRLCLAFWCCVTDNFHTCLQSPHLHTSVRRSLRPTFFVANGDVCFYKPRANGTGIGQTYFTFELTAAWV